MRLAVIPARGGSKRIARKNVRDFCGRPMIAYAIGAALESGCFDHVVVSTDDAEIASIARNFGAEVPFMRPAELSGDHVATRPVVNHAICAITDLCCTPESVCCIYPTVPFLTGAILAEACGCLETSGADFVFSAAVYPYPIQRAFSILPEGGTRRLWPEHRETRSQDLEPAYHDAGQFYWGRRSAFLSGQDSVSDGGRAFVLPSARVQDIDTHDDWERAELMYAALQAATRR